jgi:Flp pilus assembly pilin Flp
MMRPPAGEGGRGSLIDFALIIILFAIVLIVVLTLLGPQITDFLSRLVTQ